jgi:hypothetical protein
VTDAWPRGARIRLAPRDLPHFAGDRLLDSVGRVVCEARCLKRKELFESWEVARRVLRRHRGGPVLDLAGGHGLAAWFVLLLDRSTTVARVVDTRIPPSAGRLRAALGERWPDITARWTHVEDDLTTIRPTSADRVLGVHACGSLTDAVLDVALAARARVAVLPCCSSKARLDAAGLDGWVPHDLAVDLVRAERLRSEGYRVHTSLLPDDITPKNRLLLGTPAG